MKGCAAVSTFELILMGAAFWLLVTVPLALLIGRIVRRLDEQVPTVGQNDGAPAASRYGPRAGSTEDLAADLGVDEGDVRVLLRQLGEHTSEMPDELAAFLRRLLDLHGERSAPPGLYRPGADDEPRRRFGLGGPDPTEVG
jgi:hypothetical protein